MQGDDPGHDINRRDTEAMNKYRTIYADPPWPLECCGTMQGRHKHAWALRYPSMAVKDIASLPVADLAETGCHLWLWTCNQFLEDGFRVMRAWGFKYLVPITWVKPSGIGVWFIHRTQTLLMGYKDKCQFNQERFKPTVLLASVQCNHSGKPEAMADLIETVLDPPRLELFARRKRLGWDVWGNEVDSDVSLASVETTRECYGPGGEK